MTIDRRAPLRDIRNWGDFFLLTIDAPEVGRAARPGQFVMVKVSSDPAPLLRRPLSIHDVSAKGVELFFKVAGLGTEILSRKKPGETLDLIGPLGKGFSVSDEAKGKQAFLVGGGRGIAPLYFLARELAAVGTRPTVFYGGRTVADIPLWEKFEKAGFKVLCSTDDGSFGFTGLVSQLVAREISQTTPDIVYACGPDLMMQALALLAAKHDVPSELSLESVMGCGIGACWGCVHRIRNDRGDGWTKICEEGPVFPGESVVWPE